MSARPEDQNLAPEQFADLNRRFYAAESGPHDYIENRIRALLLATSDSPLIDKAAQEGVQLGSLKMSWSEGPQDPTAVERSHFLTTESSVLLHHAAETLFRLYFAHEGLPDCPWLETARLRSFSVFKRRLNALRTSLHDEATRVAISQVFIGHSTSDSRPQGMTQEGWDEHRDGLLALIDMAAETVLSDATLYNAAKHGLAVVPGESGMRLGLDTETLPAELDISAQGQALHHLKVSPKDDVPAWHEVTSWVSAESNIALTYLISTQIKTLLAIARARYLHDGDSYEAQLLSPEMIRKVSTAGWPDKAVIVKTMSMSLLYYSAAPAPGAT